MRTLFSNSASRFFQVGQIAIARFGGNIYHEPDKRCVPCRVCGIASRDPEGRARSVRTLIWFPNWLTPTVQEVDVDSLFPSTNSLFFRLDPPPWFAFKVPPIERTGPAYRGPTAAVDEAFHVRRWFRDERYETLDAWFRSVDEFVDRNVLLGFERYDIASLRRDIDVARLAALENMEANAKKRGGQW